MIETTRSLRQITGAEAQFCRSAVSLSRFYDSFEASLKRIFVCHTNVVHGAGSDKRGQHREALFTPCKPGWHPMVSERLS